ncbi:GspH/FimT family pseudopilin [Thiorhodospira sibirica]|uniref:GspH/FimT family pseudopilin n=1 Tax=Thiorhodospira sibirica TaxID=154347 RepID=UPI00022C0AE1|nr:GspH/FimT family protein [Thiorhodospira sibirica]
MRTEAGLSLIELMVALAVLAVVLAIGIPSVNQLLREQRLTTTTNLFIASVHFARSEAIKRAERVTICPSVDGQHCSNQVDYSEQWIIVVGPAPGQSLQDAGPVLRVIKGPGPRVTGNQTVARRITFEPTGRPVSFGRIDICLDSSARRVVISIMGRPRIESNHTC